MYVRAGGLMPGLVASAVGYRTDHAGPALHRGLPSPYLTFLFSLSGPVVCGRTPDHAVAAIPFATWSWSAGCT